MATAMSAKNGSPSRISGDADGQVDQPLERPLGTGQARLVQVQQGQPGGGAHRHARPGDVGQDRGDQQVDARDPPAARRAGAAGRGRRPWTRPPPPRGRCASRIQSMTSSSQSSIDGHLPGRPGRLHGADHLEAGDGIGGEARLDRSGAQPVTDDQRALLEPTRDPLAGPATPAAATGRAGAASVR